MCNYERTVTLTAWEIVRDFHLAEDIAQDSFVIAFRKLHQLRENKNFGPWILNITRREALRVTNQKAVNCDLEQLDPPQHCEVNFESEFQEVAALVALLPEQERMVISLRYFDGLSVREVASATNRPLGTVTKQLSRAIERMQILVVEVQK